MSKRRKQKLPKPFEWILYRLKGSIDGQWLNGNVQYIGRTMNKRVFIDLTDFTPSGWHRRYMLDELVWEQCQKEKPKS